MRWQGRFLATLLVAAGCLLIGCGESGTTDSTQSPANHSLEGGVRITADIPPGWEATRKPVSGLLEPRQLLTAGSFDLNPGGGPPKSKGSCTPSGLVKLMPDDGALIFVTGYSPSHLSNRSLLKLRHRPPHLRLSSFSRGRFECGGNYALSFREQGRGYNVDVWLDPGEADPEIRAQAQQLLGSLKLERPASAVSPIESFDAQLVSPTAVRVTYRLRSPADLALLVSGTKPSSASGAIPFDARGNFPDPTSEAETSPPGIGRVRVHFERGEFNFSGSPRLRFSLRATSDGHRFDSDAVTRNRDGLFGRANVEAAIRSLGE